MWFPFYKDSEENKENFVNLIQQNEAFTKYLNDLIQVKIGP